MPDTPPVLAPAAEEPAPLAAAVDLIRADFAQAMAVSAAGVVGWKTLDFWSHLAAQALGTGLVVYGMANHSEFAMGLGASLVGGDRALTSIAKAIAPRFTPALAPKAV